MLFTSSLLWAGSCPSFTPSQRYVLNLAKDFGEQQDPELYEVIGDTIGYTMAAMVWKESFVGKHIIRFNSQDGLYGSWGVMHVQLSTVFYLDGLPNMWDTRDKQAPWYISSLISNDIMAISYGYRYLRKMMIDSGSFWGGVRRYNGSGPRAVEYMNDVRKRVKILIKCSDHGVING